MDFVRSPDGSITFQTMVSVTVPAGTSVLDAENLLMDKINEAGTTLTGHLLTARDAPARPFERDGRRFTAKTKKKSAMWKRPTAAPWCGGWPFNPAPAASAPTQWTKPLP